jgi:ribonuclease P protein component
VRQLGKSYAHPLIVLVALKNEQDTTRYAIAASRSLGKAVDRNRAKRRLREALRPFMPAIAPGWDVLLLARRPLNEATFQQCQEALAFLLKRARILNDPHDDRVPPGSRLSE